MRNTILFLTIMIFALPLLAHAQSAAPAPAPGRSGEPPAPLPKAQPLKPTPAEQKVINLAQELATELNDRQVNALAGIRVNFGMMRAVRVAEHDVDQALTSCEQANPPQHDKLAAGSAGWHHALDPLIGTQEKNLNVAVHSGVAGDPAKIQAYLDALDAAATDADSHILKKPVTTASACKGLLKSMVRTQKTLTDAMAALQWPPLPATKP